MTDIDALVWDEGVASQIVAAFYQALLGREPDPTGQADKVARLRGGSLSPGELAKEMVQSPEFGNRLAEVASLAASAGRLRFTNDQSQYGEVGTLLRLWVNRQAKCGIVVDAGARGRERSNSYDLMRHFGWRGLLIEANPTLVPAIEEEFAGLDLTLISCAVSNYAGRATFTLGINDDVSSLTPELALNWGRHVGETEVDVRRIGDILGDHAIPHEFDLLSLDIEGEDIKVLNDMVDNTPYRPMWIIIEASDNYRVRTLDDGPFSTGVRLEYEIVSTTQANLILGRRHAQLADWHSRRV